MKPLLLEMCGIGPYKNKTTIDFEKVGKKGLFLITGPTGAGKTTIFDGIAFALYGNTSGMTRGKDSLRSDFASIDTDTYVILKFAHRGTVYELYRNPKYIRPKKRGEGFTEKKEDAYLKEGENTLVVGANSVNEKIQGLIGMDYPQFKQISMIAQGEFTSLLINPSKERTKIFRDIFGTGIYEKIRILINAKTNYLRSEIKTYNSKLESSIKGIEVSDEFDINNKSYEGIVNELNKEISKLEKQDQEIKEKIKDIDIKIKELAVAIKEEQTAFAIEVKLNSLKKQVEDIKSQEKDIKKSIKENELKYLEIPKNEETVEGLNIKIKRMEIFLDKLKEFSIEINKFEKRQKDYLLSFEKMKNEKDKFEYYDEILRKSMIGLIANELIEGEPCPVCGSTSHPNIAKLSNEVTSKEHVNELKKQYERAKEDSDKKHALALSSKETLSNYEMNKEDLNKIKEIENEIYEYKKESQIIKEDVEKIKKCHLKLKNDLDKNQILLNRINEEINEKEKEFEEISRRLTKHEYNIKDYLEKIEHEKREYEEVTSCYSEKISVNKRILRFIVEDLRDKEVLEKEYGIISDLENITSGKNNKNLIFEQYVLSVYFDAILNAANLRFSKMTDGRYLLTRVKEAFSGVTKDSLDIEVLDNYTGKYRGVKTLSGGEVFKAALSLAFGMSDVIQNFAGGVEINTLFIDEGFGALDSQSLDQAIESLLRIANDNRLIGIISHVQELKERIQNQIVIEKTNSGSRIIQ